MVVVSGIPEIELPVDVAAADRDQVRDAHTVALRKAAAEDDGALVVDELPFGVLRAAHVGQQPQVSRARQYRRQQPLLDVDDGDLVGVVVVARRGL